MGNLSLHGIGQASSGDNTGNINQIWVERENGQTLNLVAGGSIELPPGDKFKIMIDADAHCEYPGPDGGWAWAITIKGDGPFTDTNKAYRDGVGHTYYGDKNWEDDNVAFPRTGYYVMPTSEDVIIQRIKLWVNSESQATIPPSSSW